jgi:TrmH family RNA methyltransferase
LRITTRNATFQRWHALLTNRGKRQRAGEFLVQGVRPITLAVAHGWPIRALLYPDGEGLSRWASGVLDQVACDRAALAPALMRELGGKDDRSPELLAVVELPVDRPGRIPVRPDLLIVALRPADHHRKHRHARPLRGRVRRLRRDHQRSRRRSVRPEWSASRSRARRVP